MADLKAGTTVGGAAIWNASNLQLTPAGDFLTFRGYKVYTANDKPSAEDVGAVSLNNGGAVKGAITTTNIIKSTNLIEANQFRTDLRVGLFRTGSTPYLDFGRQEFSVTSPPTATEIIGMIRFKDGNTSNPSDPHSGRTRVQIWNESRPDLSSRLIISNFDETGATKNRMIMDSQNGQTYFDIGTFRAGTTTLGTLTGTTATFSGAVNAASLNPTSWANIDSRFMTSYTKRIPTGITSLVDSSITETSDVWTVADNFTDGPNGNTTYAGMLVNYRRAYSSGAALVQMFYTLDSTFIRTATGSPGAWTWRGGDTNGWRKVFDSSNLPGALDVNALPLTGGTLTGNLTINNSHILLNRNGAPTIYFSNNAVDTSVANPTASAYLGAINFRETSPSGLVRGHIETLVTTTGGSILQSYVRDKSGANKVITQLHSDDGLFNITLGSMRISAGNLSVNGGEVAIRAVGTANAQLLFTQANGTERSAIVSDNNNNLVFRTTGTWHNFSNQNLNGINSLNATAINATTVSSGSITRLQGNGIRGGNLAGNPGYAAILWDHGNGNVTLSGSVSAANAAGDLMLGYNAGGGYWTRNVTCEVPLSAKSTIASVGRISSSADILAATQVYAGNGAAYLNTDGNVYGTAWGGWASTWMYNTANERASAWANQQVNAYTYSQSVWTVGTFLMGYYAGGSDVGLGTLVGGGELRPSTADGAVDPNTSFPGTWMCCGRALRTNDAHRTTVWKRIA